MKANGLPASLPCFTKTSTSATYFPVSRATGEFLGKLEIKTLRIVSIEVHILWIQLQNLFLKLHSKTTALRAKSYKYSRKNPTDLTRCNIKM